MNKSDRRRSSSDWLNNNDRSKLKSVYESETACFSDLVKISGLNPSIDFRFSDLTAVDFSGSDLRGYNFAGANLSYTRWFKATWDATTNLEGALLTGAKGYVRMVTSGPPAERLIQPFFDNTEKRALERQLNYSQKMDMVGQLAGGIAHDFNNVLSAIMMANDFLLNAHKPTDPSFQDLMQIKQNATRAATLVRQLLAFSRRQTLRPQVLHLGDALSDLTMLLRRVIGEKVKLHVVHGRELWQVEVDGSEFEQGM